MVNRRRCTPKLLVLAYLFLLGVLLSHMENSVPGNYCKPITCQPVGGLEFGIYGSKIDRLPPNSGIGSLKSHFYTYELLS